MINVESVQKEINNRITANFIAEIMLNFSFPINRLYNVLHYVEFGIDPNYNDEDVIYEREYQVERSYRRINNISACFTGNRESRAKVIYEPKCYDELMFKEMVGGYNHISYLLDRPSIKVINSELLQRSMVEENFNCASYDDFWVRNGFCVDLSAMKREALTLPEVILYTVLYMTTRSRAVGTLNMELSKKADYTRALRWYEKVMVEFNSSNTCNAIIWEIFDMLFEETVTRLTGCYERNIVEFWLDEKYMNRKDRKRVISKLDKITINGKVSTEYVYAKIENDVKKSKEFYDLFENISIYEILLHDVIPYAERIVLGWGTKPSKKEIEFAEKSLKYCSNKQNVKHYDKISADYEALQFQEIGAWLADVIHKVVFQGFSVTKKIIDNLPESIAWKHI